MTNENATVNPNDVTQRAMKELGRTPEEQAILGTKRMFAQSYYIFRTLKEELGTEKATDVYWNSWLPLIKSGYDAAKEALGISEVKDVVTLGRVTKGCWQSFVCDYEIVEESPEKSVGHVHFCPNPFYGPADNHMDRIEYYSVESELSRRQTQLMVDWSGLADEVEGVQDKFMCMCGDDKYCRWTFKRKNEKGSA